MAFDYKKEYKEFYLPKNEPSIVTVPPMNYLAVAGQGDPSVDDGAFQQAIEMLYGVAYTIKMSKKTDHRIDGYFDYVVPPLEGFWWQDDIGGVDYEHKETFRFYAVIRLPDFVKEEDVSWAKHYAWEKKRKDYSVVRFMAVNEGLCVQCLHVGPFDDEPLTMEKMEAFIEAEGYETDFVAGRRHHEIYLSDPRKTEPSKLKTVLREPIRKK